MKYTKSERLNIRFNRKIKLEFHGARLTSDGGLLVYRELDEALGLFESVSAVMNDRRTGRNIQQDMTNLLRQSVYNRLARYENVNDAQRLSADPVMRAVTGKKKNAACINTIGRFETEILPLKKNLEGLSEINGRWITKAMEKTPHHRIILDMDSSESPIHGEQEGSAYNGHFGSHYYHPLFCFNQYGDCEGAMLRPGNVHSADRWKEVLEPIVRRYENKKIRKHFLSNQVMLGLFVLAYNLGNFLRSSALPGNIKHWSLRTLLVKLIKIGAKVLRHSRHVTFQMAETAIRKEIFAEILSQDKSITIMSTTISCSPIRSDGPVSLILGLSEKSSEYQRKW